MIKDKCRKTITDFSKKILKLIKNKDERYINILSIDTINIMEKISKDYKLVDGNVYLDIFYDGKKLVGGVYGLVRGNTISDLHSIIFEESSIVAKKDLLKSYLNIMKKYEILTFNVVKGSSNEKFHDDLLRRYATRCIYQYKQDNGTYMNVLGEKAKLLKYKVKLIK